MLRRITILLSLLLTVIVAQAKPINIFVSILPLKYFVTQVGGDMVKVQVMVTPGQSPETYEPTPKQIAALQNSNLYYRVGVPFETAWIAKIATVNPNLKIIDLRQNITIMPDDPHIWTSPLLVMQMAKTIENSLITTDPAHKDLYIKNYKNFLNKLTKLDQYAHTNLKNFNGSAFIVYHPAWGYFAAAYGLQQLTIEQEGKEAGPKDLANIMQLAKQKHIKAIFVQPQFSKAKADMLADTLHIPIVTLNPLAEDYLTNMYKVVDTFTIYLHQQ